MLFDGIPMKIFTDKISTSSAKHFYYYIYQSSSADNLKDLNVYLTTQTSSRYQVSARVVSDSTFARDITGKEYPAFNSDKNGTQVVNSTDYSSITTLTIAK